MPHFSFNWSSISRSCCRFSLTASGSSSYSSSSLSTSALLVVAEADFDLDMDLDLDEDDVALDEEEDDVALEEEEDDVALEEEEDDSDEEGVGAPPFWVDLEVEGIGGLVIEIEWVDWEVGFDMDAGTE